MVLQDWGNTPSDDSFNDNPYPDNDNNPPSSSSRGNGFDDNGLPRPVPILGPLIGYTQEAVRSRTEATLKYAEGKIRRDLSSVEARALASHLYKLEQVKSYWTACGMGVGVWRAYQTMAVNRYPLYLPSPGSVNPDKFLFIKGPMANAARQSSRFALYILFMGQVGNMVGAVFAQPVAARASASDPLLSQFSADLKTAIQPSGQTTGPASQRPPMETKREGSARVGGPTPWEARKRPAPSPPSDDDMSPTAGSEPWPSTASYGESAFSPDPVESQQPQSSTQFPRSPGSRRPNRPTEESASPSDAMFPEESPSDAKPGESAWDRLRRGAGPLPNQRPPPHSQARRPEPREGSTLGDSFTFADTDEERRLGQERAQREFDERIAREREGKDFSDDKKW